MGVEAYSYQRPIGLVAAVVVVVVDYANAALPPTLALRILSETPTV